MLRFVNDPFYRIKSCPEPAQVYRIPGPVDHAAWNDDLGLEDVHVGRMEVALSPQRGLLCVLYPLPDHQGICEAHVCVGGRRCGL